MEERLQKILSGISGGNTVGLAFSVFQFADEPVFHSSQMSLLDRLVGL